MNLNVVEINLSQEEVKIIRKCLQCVRLAHMVTETAEGISDRDTPIDALIRKFRAFEGEEHEHGSNV